MKDPHDLIHIFRAHDEGAPINPITERFCRPGAAFGPARLEVQMGPRLQFVFHERTTRLPCGKRVCVACRLVEVH